MALVSTPIAFREKTESREHGEALAPDREAILQKRIKDLKLHIPGTPLEKFIQQLYAELDARGLSFKPSRKRTPIPTILLVSLG